MTEPGQGVNLPSCTQARIAGRAIAVHVRGMRPVIIRLLMIVLALLGAARAEAHSPYFGGRGQMTHPEFGNVQVIALHGDGIVVADPVRGVAINSGGVMLATTPLLVDTQILCDPDQDRSVCRVYDPVAGVIYDPDLEAWQEGVLIVDITDDRPIADPELIDAEYGFIARKATWLERARFDLIALTQNPVGTSLAILYWVAVWMFLMRILLRWAGAGWRLVPARIGLLMWTVGHVVLFALGWVLAALGWLWAPYSLISAGLVCGLGALLAILGVCVARRRTVQNAAAISSGK